MSISVTKFPGPAGDGIALESVAHPDRGWQIQKRSVRLAGHRTSVSVENSFWWALKDVARRRHLSLDALILEIDVQRNGGNLSSAIRLAVLIDAQERAFPAPGATEKGVICV